MKKIMMSFIAISSLGIVQSAMATPPHFNVIRFECPKIDELSNTGVTISGMGMEEMGKTKVRPVFEGQANSTIPLDLSKGSYCSKGVIYESRSGKIACSFASCSSFGPFTVSHTVLNGKGGVILKASDSAITIKFPEA